MIFTESQSADDTAKAKPEHKKKDVKKAMIVKSDDEPANDEDQVQENIGKF